MTNRFIAVICFLLLGMAFGVVPQSAQASDIGLGALKNANAEIRAILARADAPAPSLGDTSYARLVSNAFAVPVIASFKPEPVQAVLDLCSDVVKTQVAYQQWGLGQDHLAGLAPQAAAQRATQHANANFFRFQDEMAFALRFSTACLAMEVDHLTEFLQQLKPEDLTSQRRTGLSQFQNGLVQAVSGSVLEADS